MKKLFFAAVAIALLFSSCADSAETATDNGNNVTVTFNCQGLAPNPPSQTVPRGEPVIVPQPEPANSNAKFLGWFISTYDGAPEWDFEDPVEESFTLYAMWVAGMVNITFNSEGSEPATYTIFKGDAAFDTRSELENLHTQLVRREGFILEGWFYEGDFATPVTFPADFTDVESTPLYAKWIDIDDIDVVWTYTAGTVLTNLLVVDEYTGWLFRHMDAAPRVDFFEVPWNVNPISLSADKNTLTLEIANVPVPLSKADTGVKTPQIDSRLTGYWSRIDRASLYLSIDGSAIVTEAGEDASVDMAHAADENNLYLLRKDAPHYVLMTVPLDDNDKPFSFSKIFVDDRLLGIWEITSDGKRAVFEFTTRTYGRYHALGVSSEFTYTLSESVVPGELLLRINQLDDKSEKYGPYSYDISGETLTVYGEGDVTLTYTKRDEVPRMSGGGGDAGLVAQWNYTDNSGHVLFRGEGTFDRFEGGIFTYCLWQANGTNLIFYSPDIGSVPGDDPIPYTISGLLSNFLEFGGKNYEQLPVLPLKAGR